MKNRVEKHKVLIWTGPFRTNLVNKLRGLNIVDVVEAHTEAEALDGLSVANVFITSSAIWSGRLSVAVDESREIRWIQLLNAGYDNVIEAALPDRVLLSTIGAQGSHVVAEHAIALLLAVVRQIPDFARNAANHSPLGPQSDKISTLYGKDVLVFGYGHIGRQIAKMLSCLGANITVVAKRKRRDPDTKIQVRSQDQLNLALQSIDALIICAPLNSETLSAINRSSFDAMKPGCYIVNVSRGAIIDTEALTDSVKSGRIAGAALDVTEPEPLPKDHPLRRLSNVLISPHVAWAGGGEPLKQSLENYVIANVRNFVSGRIVENVVSFE